MGRYLLFISYIGTGLHGLQKQGGSPHLKTVVGILESVLVNDVQPTNDVNVVTSSRTDSGVHAICNSVHVDLQHRDADRGRHFDPDFITVTINNRLIKAERNIRVLRTLRVRDNFHCRFWARSRSYVYRLSINQHPERQWAVPFSALEHHRSYFVRDGADVPLMRDAVAVLDGCHDFRAFTNPTALVRQPWLNPVKRLTARLSGGEAAMQRYMRESDRAATEHWDLAFSANSFLNKQVRKMVALVLAVGQGRMELDTLRWMLTEPVEAVKRDTSMYNVPPYGLYLTHVQYDQRDLIAPENVTTKETSQRSSTSTGDC